MHSLRFDDLSIYITEKVMEYCGKFSAKYIIYYFNKIKKKSQMVNSVQWIKTLNSLFNIIYIW